MATTASLTNQQLTARASMLFGDEHSDESLIKRVLRANATRKLDGAKDLDEAYLAARRTLQQDHAATAVATTALCWGMPEALYIPADTRGWALGFRSDGQWEYLFRDADEDGAWWTSQRLDA